MVNIIGLIVVQLFYTYIEVIMDLQGMLESFYAFIMHWYWIPMMLFYIGVIGAILIENGNPTKTIAWMLVIIFIPFLGLILYYFFGQKYVKVYKMKKFNRKQALNLEKKWQELDPIMEALLQDLQDEIGGFSKVFRLLKTERLSTPSLYNNVDVLINGEMKFPRFKEDLLQAKSSIHLEYYIFEPDRIGLEILDILEKKAAEGVEVRLLVDSFGSPRLIKYMRKRIDTKIMFYAFMPVTFTSLANSNYRNHRKIAVIDGKVGYVGGINIADKYINYPEDQPDKLYWRDTSVRIAGNAVNLLQISFWNSWSHTEGKPFVLEQGYLNLDDFKKNRTGTAGVGLIASDPASIGPFNMEAILLAIGEANTRIRLCTPYYIPSQELERALIIAASSGVEVELMIPTTSDSFFVKHASFSFLKALLERDVKIYLYEKGFIHAKTLTVDDKISFVGTVNLDIRSFYINYEVSAVISDTEVCRRLQQQFEEDKLVSKLLTLEAWKARPRTERAMDSVCRLLGPVL